MFILFIFLVCKFWRDEKKDKNTANAALMPYKNILNKNETLYVISYYCIKYLIKQHVIKPL